MISNSFQKLQMHPTSSGQVQFPHIWKWWCVNRLDWQMDRPMVRQQMIAWPKGCAFPVLKECIGKASSQVRSSSTCWKVQCRICAHLLHQGCKKVDHKRKTVSKSISGDTSEKQSFLFLFDLLNVIEEWSQASVDFKNAFVSAIR